MLVRHRRWLLNSLSALCAGASVAVALWAALSPVAIDHISPSRPTARVANTDSVESTQPELVEFEPYWERPLRKPLFDPPPVVETPPAPPPPPPLNVRLVGTILEPGRAVAVLANAAGKIEMKAVGQSTGDPGQPAEILEVHRERVVVRYAGETRELLLETR